MSDRTGDISRGGQSDPWPVPEETLLALVEGELSAAEEADVLRTLAAHPEALRKVNGMRRDRTALVSMGAVKAPLALTRAAERMASERALAVKARLAADTGRAVRPAQTQDIAGRIQREPARSGGGAHSELPKWNRQDVIPLWPRLRLVAAAAAITVACAGLYFGATTLRDTMVTPNRTEGPFARTDENDPEGRRFAANTETAAPPATADETGHERPFAKAGPSRTSVYAGSTPAETGVDGSPLAMASDAAVHPLDIQRPVPKFVRELDQPDNDVTAARAIELAREGRLLIRVRGADLRKSTDQIAALAQERESARSWRLSTSIPDVLAQMAPKVPPARALDIHLSATASGPVAKLLIAEQARKLTRMVSEVSLPATLSSSPSSPGVGAFVLECQASVASLKAAVRSLAISGVVRFEEIDEPLFVGSADDVESVLWWTEPSSAWVPRLDVPVVVDLVSGG